MFSSTLSVASKFEVAVYIIVIALAANALFMPSSIPLKNIEEEQKTDFRNAMEIARILRFLRDIEQD
jgi:hypothetical protein